MIARALFALSIFLAFSLAASLAAQEVLLLKPAAVFDGMEVHRGWVVLVEGEKISAAGPTDGIKVPANARSIELPNETLLPGLIEGHAHLFLHPYNETSWNEQVTNESFALRTARATAQARRTLAAGFTTVRDLGTEGAGFADVGLKQAIDAGIIPGPRLLVATRALVATGSYGPKYASEITVPQGAQECSGAEDCVRAAREQIGKGADVVKVYADYRWGSGEPSRPTFSQEELNAIVQAAHSAGRPVAAHATTPEGMRRAINAGVETIEHGDEGTLEIFKLMKEKGVAFCPTVAAGDAISRYRGWKPEDENEPPRLQQKRASMKAARAAGVNFIMGGDVGVFPHGENVREMELLVRQYGFSALEILRQATSGNASALRLPDRGAIKAGLLADLIAIEGDPTQEVSALRRVKFVLKGGREIRLPNE